MKRKYLIFTTCLLLMGLGSLVLVGVKYKDISKHTTEEQSNLVNEHISERVSFDALPIAGDDITDEIVEVENDKPFTNQNDGEEKVMSENKTVTPKPVEINTEVSKQDKTNPEENDESINESKPAVDTPQEFDDQELPNLILGEFDMEILY